MKTKNIFKALAFAILMPALLLNTACNSEIINNENTDGKGFALPVTVNVTRQGDDATKATYNESTGKLSFSEGDKLLVRGNDNSVGGAGSFAGMLDYDTEKGNFSGTIYTQNEYSGTADELFSAASGEGSIQATLLPAGYESYGFLAISGSGYNTSYSMIYDKAIAATKAAAVEQFSLERTKTYSSGFALSPENAILNFTITGLTNGAKEVTLKDRNGNTARTMFIGSVTPSSGTAAFALGARIIGYNDWPVNLKNLTLKVGGTDIDITDTNNNLAAGKIYNITRAVPLTYPIALSAATSAYVGSVVTTDGNVYATVADASTASKTAAAMITYVSSTGHGLALALADEGQMSWDTAVTTCNSKNNTTLVDNCTWKFADLYEMDTMVSGAGDYVALRDGFSRVGATNMQAADYWVNDEYYYDKDEGIFYNFSLNNSGRSPKNNIKNVRACLAF